MADLSAAANSGEDGALAVDAALILPAELTIYTVGELHPKWTLWAQVAVAQTSGKAAEIHAQMVAEVDAAGLQLLLSLQRALSMAGRGFEIFDASSALSKACSGLGLSDWLHAHSKEANQ